MGYSRQIFALGREGFLPKFLAKIHPTFKTPYIAIIAGGIFGIAIIFSDNLIVIGGQSLSANIVTMSVFGAIIMYITSILSLFKLRSKEPNLERPFLTPFYPIFPIIALVLSFVCLLSLIYFNLLLSIIFLGLFVLSGLYSFLFYKEKPNEKNKANLLA